MRLYVEEHNHKLGYAVSREFSDADSSALSGADAANIHPGPVRYFSNLRHARKVVERFNRRQARREALAAFAVGAWLRYSEAFCRDVSTTEAGFRDKSSRVGQVLHIFGEGKLCNVDWGDVILQHDVGSPLLVAYNPPG